MAKRIVPTATTNPQIVRPESARPETSNARMATALRPLPSATASTTVETHQVTRNFCSS